MIAIQRLRALLLPIILGMASVEALATTKVIHFQPSAGTRPTVSGYCWTQAISTNRADAWRCMVNNTIYDPCFFNASAQKMVCGADPLKPDPGFYLKLTKPLPAPEKTTANNHPWLIELENKHLCRPYTGTTPSTGEIIISYYCMPSEQEAPSKDCGWGLVEGSMQVEEIWTAIEVRYCLSPSAKAGIEITNLDKKEISRVWE